MIDKFAIILTHVLMALAAWRLMLRDDLDPPREPRGSLRKRQTNTAAQGVSADGAGAGDA